MHSRILAIFDTPEGAGKAINASPLKITLLDRNLDDDEKDNDRATVLCEISASKVDHYNDIIRKNPYFGAWTLDYGDARVSDIIDSGAPRHEFADCFPSSKQHASAADIIKGVDRDLDDAAKLGAVSARSLAETLNQRAGEKSQ